MTLGVHAGPRWLVSPTTEVSILAFARRRWDGTGPTYDDLGLRFEGRQRAGPKTLLTFNTSWQDRDWRDQPERNGPITRLSFGGYYQAAPNLTLNASLFGERERPDRDTRRNTSYGLGLGVSHDMSYGITVGFDASMRWTDYDKVSFQTSDGGKRSDRTTDLSVNLSKRDHTIGGFSPRLTIGHAWRDTNATLYDYPRTYGEINFVRQF